jgi:hypothetical protein
MSNGHGASPGERRRGRVAGTKNKATIEQENLISRAMGKLDRPLGKDVLAEVMVEFRETSRRGHGRVSRDGQGAGGGGARGGQRGPAEARLLPGHLGDR